jgi:GNAT superfamily N-acetyltransferase
MSRPLLQPGYSDVPPGKIASVVTCLEMTAPPSSRPAKPLPRPLALEAWPKPEIEAYRALYRAVGQDWLWFSRLLLPDAGLEAIIGDPKVEVFALLDGRRRIGLLELDFREDGECELAFFGLVPEAIGQGAGRFLMLQATQKAWAKPIRRFWVHTCSLDHPSALAFYQRSGFTPYALMVEVADDPRLVGTLPREAAPQIPIVGG